MAARLTLTFDNGPTPGVTERVLDQLAARGIPATFFVVGTDLLRDGRRELAERAAQEGHWHGNHTMTHSIQFGDSDDSRLPEREIGDSQRVLGELAHPDRLFRPWGNGSISRRILSPAAIDYLREGNKGEKLVDYLTALGDKLAEERHELDGELNDLIDKIGHVKGIVATQQDYARRVHFSEHVEISTIVEDVLGLHRQRLTSEDIEIVRDYRDRINAQLEKANLVQVLDNLVKNAIDAMAGRKCRRRVLSIQLAIIEHNQAEIIVADTGCGINKQHLQSIFSYGFSTKLTGNGFGLHSSALAISNIGGTISVESDGWGQGARFIVRFPLQGTNPDWASPADRAGLPGPEDHSTAERSTGNAVGAVS
jgi:signal transduction histidine kinase